MIQKKLFHKTTALLLLLLFALSITPKKVLHDAVANHIDTQATTGSFNYKVPLLSKASIHCPIDNLVVISPFENTLTATPTFIFSFCCIKNSKPQKSFHSAKYIIVGLRGPPFSC